LLRPDCNSWCSTLGSVPQRRSSIAIGMSRSGHNSALTVGSHNSTLALDGLKEQQDHIRIEQLEKRLFEVLQREASLNV
jgi:hypothetical protein